MNDFNKRTINKLAKKGISIMGKQAVAAFEGDVYFSGVAYIVNDNGTCRVWTFQQVLSAAS